MNLKKIIISLIITIMVVATVILQSAVYAAELNPVLTMGVIPLMEENMGYSIFNPNQNEAGGKQGAHIWNIVKYDSTDSTTYKTNQNLYCLKQGIGLSSSNLKANYNVSYDMRADRGAIGNQNAVLSGLVNGTITEGNQSINQYDAILAALDMMLPTNATKEQKKELVKKSLDYGIKNIEIYKANDTVQMLWTFIDDETQVPDNYVLTNSEVKAVQQAVLWYFTNHDKYDLTNEGDVWLRYITDKDDPIGGNSYKTLDTYGDQVHWEMTNENAQKPRIGQLRAYQANCLYHYFISQAKLKAPEYNQSNMNALVGSPVKVTTTTLQGEESGDNWILGPIYMEEKANNTKFYTMDDLVVKNKGTAVSKYELLDENKQAVASGTTVKSLVGKNFYVSIPKNEVESITIDFNIKYKEKGMTLYASTTNNQEQPIVEVGEKEKTEPTTLKFEPEKPKESFDLKLMKRITAVNNQNVPERIENIDVSKLNTIDADGNMITTGIYKWNEEPVPVKKGDIVTYTLTIYNEGTMDGYAQEITEDIPEGLEFIWSEKQGEDLKADQTLTDAQKEAIEFNQNYLWGKFVYDESGERITKISSDYLSKEKETTAGGNLITAFGLNDGTKTKDDLHSKEISVKFKVVAENIEAEPIRNEAAITEDCDKDGKPVDDRDSHTQEWKEHPNHEDDEDHDYIILQSFDLALRKFIVAVSDDTTIEKNDELRDKNGLYKRAPIVDTSKLNTKGEDGQLITTATYNHTKEPLLVKPNDIIVYMLRVYNEGDCNGYASEIKDHLPPYLDFVEGEFNKQYGWELSEDGRTATTRYLEDSLINHLETNEDGEIVLTYKEVPIMCKVSDTVKSSEKITNIADITEYLDENKKPVIDRDSEEDNVKLPADKDLPTYKDNETRSYVPGQQDDDDFEKVIVKIFDLALRKWVTEAIVIENGGQTVTQTGHKPWDDPEAVVKVELHRKKLNQVTVKFRYSIRVYNQGELEGYAKEVTDYIPEGLKFVAADNPDWKDEGNNVISTRKLENTLLKPGEYADVEVLLTWINSENNMGVMINTAEISEDDNEFDVPDIDSTPDNQKPGEDDIDDAPVMISISTGQIRIYFTLGLIVLVTMASGVVLIKKFVL